MNCESVVGLMSLYLYGELPSGQEEELEQHLHECGACRAALESERTFQSRLSSTQVAPSPVMLAECRRDLFNATERKPRASWLSMFRLSFSGMMRPVGAMALVALGFFGSRLTTREGIPVNQASLMGEPIVSTIRSIQPDASGHVQIALDETRRRLVTGSLSDGNIERLMLAAARDESNDGLRVESIEILKRRTSSVDVRDALLTALRNDPNPGVRFKALDGLKGMAAQPEVRQTLSYVLQNDMNPGVRIQAIDLLTQQQDSDLVGMLQRVVTKESNNYVRQRCERALQELNASVGTF
jgi:hypothetical protein